jgi:hypothetical protein
VRPLIGERNMRGVASGATGMANSAIAARQDPTMQIAGLEALKSLALAQKTPPVDTRVSSTARSVDHHHESAFAAHNEKAMAVAAGNIRIRYQSGESAGQSVVGRLDRAGACVGRPMAHATAASRRHRPMPPGFLAWGPSPWPGYGSLAQRADQISSGQAKQLTWWLDPDRPTEPNRQLLITNLITDFGEL